MDLDTKIKSTDSSSEQESLFNEESVSTVKNTSRKENCFHDDADEGDTNAEPQSEKYSPAALKRHDDVEIKVWRTKTIRIRRPLIPLRIAQFLWFGSSRLNTPFLSLVLKHRGLDLSEYTAVFSLLFLFQLVTAHVSGIIADKIGNAKPVLLFYMSGSILMLVCIIYAPTVQDKNCKLDGSLKNGTNFEYCNDTCFQNYSSFLNSESDYDHIYDNGTSISLNETNVIYNKSCSCTKNVESGCSSESRTGFRVLYSVIILSFFLVWSGSYRFLDFISVTLAEENDSDFGRERTFAKTGEIVIIILSIFILNIDKSETRQFYDNIYWITIVLKLFALIAVLNIEPVRLPPGRKLMKKTFNMFRDLEIVSFLIVLLVAGNGYTFNQYYHFWFLASLNAPRSIFGFHLLAFACYGLPMYLTSKCWIKWFGTRKIFVLALLAYSVNSISYSFLFNPWLSLLIELTTPFGFHLLWVTAVVHCYKIAPTGFAATLNSLIGAIHFSAGRSASIPIGGFLITNFGMRTAYRVYACVFLTTAILYSIFIYLRKLVFARDSQVNEPEEMKSMNREVEQDL